jgi:ClpP class serine protease
MAHELLRLREKLCNTPHLIHPSSFETIVDYLEKRCEDGEAGQPVEATSRYSFNKDIGVAVLNIDGPLTYKPVTMMGFDCGGTSYTQLKEDFTYLVEQGAKTISLHTSSGGGEAFQVFATARYMRKLADANDVKLISFVDGLSASAAYALSSIADEIILNEGSEVGSIGVLVRLMNDSKALEKEGYERVFITAGDSKVPFDKDGSFREGFLADLQEKVDTLYVEFTEFVASNRNLSVDAVRSTQAKTFLPDRAIELGLADSVMDLESYYTYLADTAQKEKGTMLKTQLFKLNKEEETLQMSQEQLAQFEEMQTQMSAMQASLEEAVSMKASLEALIGEKDTALAEALSQVAKMQEEQVAQKLQARKDKLAAVMAADKVEGVAASLASLDDAAFETVLGSFSVQAKAVAESDLFTEMGAQGVEAEATSDAVKASAPKTTSLDEVLKARLQNR